MLPSGADARYKNRQRQPWSVDVWRLYYQQLVDNVVQFRLVFRNIYEIQTPSGQVSPNSEHVGGSAG